MNEKITYTIGNEEPINYDISQQEQTNYDIPNELNYIKGPAGLSAYEVWLNQGNKGTVEDYLESLKGKDGIDGKNGLDGKDGVDGKDGLPGTTDFYKLDNMPFQTIELNWTEDTSYEGIIHWGSYLVKTSGFMQLPDGAVTAFPEGQLIKVFNLQDIGKHIGITVDDDVNLIYFEAPSPDHADLMMYVKRGLNDWDVSTNINTNNIRDYLPDMDDYISISNLSQQMGIDYDYDGKSLKTSPANSSDIYNRNDHKPIVPSNFEEALTTLGSGVFDNVYAPISISETVDNHTKSIDSINKNILNILKVNEAQNIDITQNKTDIESLNTKLDNYIIEIENALKEV